MQRWKQIVKRIFFPPIVWIIVCSVLSVFALPYSFIGEGVLPIVQYISYAFSAYTLIVICCRLPKIIKRIRSFWQNNPYWIRYQTDRKLQVKISLYTNTVCNGLFSIFHLLIGIVYQSIWAYSLAGYYVLLSVMRIFLLFDAHSDLEKDGQKQWKRYRFCGKMLALMDLPLFVIVFLIVYQKQGFSYHFIYTIGLAAFTFTMTTFAIVNVVRYRKDKQPILSATKYVSMASALVSMLSLETAMLNAFGGENGEAFRRIITSLTGGAVCLFVLAIGVYMWVLGSKKCSGKE